MDKASFKMLNHISEGIIITNDTLQIMFCNSSIENVTNTKLKNVENISLLKAFPGLDENYFYESMQSTLKKGHKFFYSAAMHKDVISKKTKFNIRFNRFRDNDDNFLIIECTDVTNQIRRVNQLKKINNELKGLNTKLKSQEKEIKKLAYYDKLTGLANRTLFYNVAEKILEDSIRNYKKMVLMFIDIDNFKSVNDMYGHKAGDKVLVEIANLLTTSTRKLDVVSRHGGDEFLILLPDIKEYDNYKAITQRINKANKAIYVKDQVSIKVYLSIGVSFYPEDGENIDELISKADKAMYLVKKQGGDGCLELP